MKDTQQVTFWLCDSSLWRPDSNLAQRLDRNWSHVPQLRQHLMAFQSVQLSDGSPGMKSMTSSLGECTTLWIITHMYYTQGEPQNVLGQDKRIMCSPNKREQRANISASETNTHSSWREFTIISSPKTPAEPDDSVPRYQQNLDHGAVQVCVLLEMNQRPSQRED